MSYPLFLILESGWWVVVKLVVGTCGWWVVVELVVKGEGDPYVTYIEPASPKIVVVLMNVLQTASYLMWIVCVEDKTVVDLRQDKIVVD